MNTRNLYKVRCVSEVAGGQQSLDVYMVAEGPSKAQDAALDKMRELDYRYTDFTDCIELIASEDQCRAGCILVVVV